MSCAGPNNPITNTHRYRRTRQQNQVLFSQMGNPIRNHLKKSQHAPNDKCPFRQPRCLHSKKAYYFQQHSPRVPQSQSQHKITSVFRSLQKHNNIQLCPAKNHSVKNSNNSSKNTRLQAQKPLVHNKPTVLTSKIAHSCRLSPDIVLSPTNQSLPQQNHCRHQGIPR